MKEVLVVILVAFVMAMLLIFVAEWVVVDHNGNIEFQWITNNVVDVSLD